MAARRATRLALDQNFPTPILAAHADFIVDIDLVPLRKIDARLRAALPNPIPVGVSSLVEHASGMPRVEIVQSSVALPGSFSALANSG